MVGCSVCTVVLGTFQASTSSRVGEEGSVGGGGPRWRRGPSVVLSESIHTGASKDKTKQLTGVSVYQEKRTLMGATAVRLLLMNTAL